MDMQQASRNKISERWVQLFNSCKSRFAVQCASQVARLSSSTRNDKARDHPHEVPEFQEYTSLGSPCTEAKDSGSQDNKKSAGGCKTEAVKTVTFQLSQKKGDVKKRGGG